jgi:hypothetical protein
MLAAHTVAPAVELLLLLLLIHLQLFHVCAAAATKNIVCQCRSCRVHPCNTPATPSGPPHAAPRGRHAIDRANENASGPRPALKNADTHTERSSPTRAHARHRAANDAHLRPRSVPPLLLSAPPVRRSPSAAARAERPRREGVQVCRRITLARVIARPGGAVGECCLALPTHRRTSGRIRPRGASPHAPCARLRPSPSADIAL